METELGADPNVSQDGTHWADQARIERLVELVRSHDTERLLSAVLPGLVEEDREALVRHCRFAHAAALIFPRRWADAPVGFAASRGAGAVKPSVVVRDRLSRRYARLADSLEVGILRVPMQGDDGQVREIELFLLAQPLDGAQSDIAADERANQYETHVAFEVTSSDSVVLSGLRTLLTAHGRLVADGGGYNGHEDATILYFSRRDCRDPLYRRLELIAKGRHPRLLEAHIRQSTPSGTMRVSEHAESAGAGAAERLLRLMTGAWATQAIAVAAELSLADHIARNPCASSDRLAQQTGTDADALARLLRYLASLGILRSVGTGFVLTEVGQSLRTDTSPSLQPLARMYGGPFYRSFGSLMHTVRTGREAFAHVFGENHFAHFAARPELAALFDRSMESSATIFMRLADVVDFGRARVVVDVAGGSGALLARLLPREPHLRGILLERPHAIEAARLNLAAARCVDRCEFVGGDFTRGVPTGGDVYILSRVLHDWSDEVCREILARCAEAMPSHGELLIVERLLPEDDTPSLALAWDLHMMCNVGGRERTARDYGRLLGASGFRVLDCQPLPLDAAVLRAVRCAS